MIHHIALISFCKVDVLALQSIHDRFLPSTFWGLWNMSFVCSAIFSFCMLFEHGSGNETTIPPSPHLTTNDKKLQQEVPPYRIQELLDKARRQWFIHATPRKCTYCTLAGTSFTSINCLFYPSAQVTAISCLLLVVFIQDPSAFQPLESTMPSKYYGDDRFLPSAFRGLWNMSFVYSAIFCFRISFEHGSGNHNSTKPTPYYQWQETPTRISALYDSGITGEG